MLILLQSVPSSALLHARAVLATLFRLTKKRKLASAEPASRPRSKLALELKTATRTRILLPLGAHALKTAAEVSSLVPRPASITTALQLQFLSVLITTSTNLRWKRHAILLLARRSAGLCAANGARATAPVATTVGKQDQSCAGAALALLFLTPTVGRSRKPQP